MYKKPKVSVLMPIYKTDEQFLKEAIESVLAQTFTNFELLILDDCPEDTRENLVKSFKDKRIKYIKSNENSGIARARNKLINMAKGNYLAVMDHDDISLPTRFEKQVTALDEDPNIGVVGCFAKSFPDGNLYKFPKDDFEIKKLLMGTCAIMHPASMIRKSVLTNNNVFYEEMYSPAEDYRLWLRLIPFTKFYNIDEVLFCYRFHENNTSKKQSSKMRDATKKLSNEIKVKYPVLYQAYLDDRTQISRWRLLGIIPFLTIKKNQNKIKIYLFGLLILSSKRSIVPWPNK